MWGVCRAHLHEEEQAEDEAKHDADEGPQAQVHRVPAKQVRGFRK